MALQASYKQFLAAPSSSALAENASLHYVTTTSSFTSATDIIKHLATLRNKVKKKKEGVLFAVEDKNALALEVEMTLEFLTSGGPYLPGLDDNFLADRTVDLVITHVVTFDTDGKITLIRQSWDQGALLKQVEVIGRSGQNWPIRDIKDQIKLIAKAVKGGGAAAAPAEELPIRSRGSSTNTNTLRDPRASLDLFAPREELENAPATVISPYAGRRPRQRSFTEILGDEPVPEPGSPSSGRERSQSPSKAIPPKVGAGKHFQPPRLFETDENDADADAAQAKRPADRVVRPHPKKYEHFDFDDGSEAQELPAADTNTSQTKRPADRVVRPHPKKYEHFDFDDGSEAPAPKPAAGPAAVKKSKRDSQWSFDDFVTPQKPVPTRGMHPARDVRHWSTEDQALDDAPAQKAPAAKPRRDAEAHFELLDDGPVNDEPRNANRPPRGAAHNDGLHLYDNRVYIEEGTVPTPGPPALGNITNLKDRRKDFEAHFKLTDESPGPSNGGEAPRVPEDRKKVVKMMQSSWAAYDESPAPAPVSRKENDNPNANRTGDDRGIHIAGDGMGGKKGSSRGWLTGEDEESAPAKKPVGRGPPAKSDGFWDF
ncbi:hypothetical protein VTK56DRAFT_1554 [Thermocarpiscus australiensis]